MKKAVLLLFIGMLMGSVFLYADDALTMPARTGRLYIVPSYIYANGSYNSEGTFVSTRNGKGDVKMFNLSMALEYGIIDWITGAVQWSPGWNAWSKVDMSALYLSGGSLPSPATMDINVKDVGDLFIGAKFQLIGASAPLKLDFMRFALATGIKAPLNQINFMDELGKVEPQLLVTTFTGNPTESITMATLDRHVLGFGVRSYLDYIFTENFFINFYNETLFYPFSGKLKNYSPTALKSKMTEYVTDRVTTWGMMQCLTTGTQPTQDQIDARTLIESLNARSVVPDYSVNYKFDTTLEMEAHMETTINNSKGKPLGLALGLPVTWNIKPDITIDGSRVYNSSSQALQLRPNASIFFYGWKLPTQFQFTYAGTVWGHNTQALQALSLYVKFYFQIPGGSVRAVSPAEGSSMDE